MLIFAAILAIFVYGMIAAMLGTILPELSERFHLTPTQNGTIALVQALGLIIASLGVGPLLDTQGDKIGLILGLSCIAVALFLLPRSSGFRPILLLLFLLGMGGGIVVTGANALANSVSGEHSAIALNLVNLFFGLGGLTTPFIAANIFKKNWVRLCYTIASLTVVALIVQAFSKMPAPSGNAQFLLADVGPILGIESPLATALQIETVTGGDAGQFTRFMSAYTGPAQLFVSASVWQAEFSRSSLATFMTTNLSPANPDPYSPADSSEPPMLSFDSVMSRP